MGWFWCATRKRQLQHQRISPNPDVQANLATGNNNPLACHDTQQLFSPTNKTNSIATNPMHSSGTKSGSVAAKPGAGNSNSLPGHQSGRLKMPTYNLHEQQGLNLSDNLHTTGASGDHDANTFSSSSLIRKKNLSTSDLDPTERKKQAALAKVEAKLEKAQRLHEQARQSVEQEVADFLRATTMPNTNVEGTAARTVNASFDKRIRTLQDTKKELEKKISNYQSDISRIQAGDIPHNYTSSKDIFSNIKSTAAKVAGGSLKYRPSQSSDQPTATASSTPNTPDHIVSSHHPDSENYQQHPNPFTTITTPTPTATPTGGPMNNNQNMLTSNLYSGTHDPIHSSLSSSASNEIGNSQFYIDSNHEYVYDNDKSSRKHEGNVPVDGIVVHDSEKSPSFKRRYTDESNPEFNDQKSDHSNDERHTSSITKRNISVKLRFSSQAVNHDQFCFQNTSSEYQQLNIKLESMQKALERYETKFNDMQKQIDSLTLSIDTQRDQNDRLNIELTDLTDLHQIEMSSVKTDLKNLEERLLYKFNDYWNELLEKLDKLDTRTAKVEQTQTHSLETEENTHRIISKLVNILLTVFAIILLILSTIKNLVQSRIHAMTILILAVAWITFRYLPPNYFQTPFLKNLLNGFKRTARNSTSE
ncbi:unnamed protein product [Adineta ricciae]|uniref:Uncharacterized protein n=1 Tax=Adineta ricciae TaxID=249248 RepID=A0A815VQS7_ADIRI|nr:unnamed protein product [Adineta ricciae]